MNYKIDGHIWYRVKLQDGTQGYISEAYIQNAPKEKNRLEEGIVNPEEKVTIKSTGSNEEAADRIK